MTARATTRPAAEPPAGEREPGGRLPGERPAPRRAPRPAGSAAALVSALWRTAPPAVALGADGGAGTRPALAAALARVAERANRLTVRGPAAGREAARLLAETAHAVGAALHAEEPAGVCAGGLASPVRLRLTRMERWLAARAAADASAVPAADLCLWVLEHLEANDL